MEIKVKLIPLTMPDGIHYDDGVKKNKQDGFNPNDNYIPIENLSIEQAEEYAELLKQTFIEHYNSQMKNQMPS